MKHYNNTRPLLFPIVAAGLISLTTSISNGQTRDTSAQVGRSSDPIQRVETMEQLKPQTPGERERAEKFDTPGGFKLTPGTRIVSTPDHPVEPVLNNDRVRVLNPDGSTSSLPTLPPASTAATDPLGRAVCNSALVVIGRPASRRTLLTKSETGLFTDYAIDVLHVVRPPEQIKRLLVTHRRGQVEVGGQLVQDIASTPIVKLNSLYLLLLRHEQGITLDSAYMLAESPIILGGPDTKDSEPDYLARLHKIAEACKEK